MHGGDKTELIYRPDYDMIMFAQINIVFGKIDPIWEGNRFCLKAQKSRSSWAAFLDIQIRGCEIVYNTADNANRTHIFILETGDRG